MLANVSFFELAEHQAPPLINLPDHHTSVLSLTHSLVGGEEDKGETREDP